MSESESITVKLNPETIKRIDDLAKEASKKSGVDARIGRATTIRKLVERQLEKEKP